MKISEIVYEITEEALKFRKLLVIYLEENSDSQILDDAIEAAFESH